MVAEGSVGYTPRAAAWVSSEGSEAPVEGLEEASPAVWLPLARVTQEAPEAPSGQGVLSVPVGQCPRAPEPQGSRVAQEAHSNPSTPPPSGLAPPPGRVLLDPPAGRSVLLGRVLPTAPARGTPP